jgi:hypothetical protein
MIRDKNREISRIEKIKDGMYVEIIYENLEGCTTKFKLSNDKPNYDEGCAKTELKVRQAPRSDSEILGTAVKGDIFTVVEVEETDPMYIWFRIIYQKNWKDKYQEGYIAQPRSSKTKYVEPYGIEFDYSAPTIACKDYDCTKDYEVESIDDINTDDVIAWDDQEGKKVTFEVFIEREPTDRPGPQYWVKWTVTDKKGKSASVKQRVIFKFPPSDSKVKDFSQIKG